MKNLIKILFVLPILLAGSSAYATDMGPCIIGGAVVGAAGAVLEIKGKINPNMLGKTLIAAGGCVVGGIAVEATINALEEKDLQEPASNNQPSEE